MRYFPYFNERKWEAKENTRSGDFQLLSLFNDGKRFMP
jgi:hypothetical protein